MDTTGSNSKRLTENKINDRSPSISPSGLWIAWSADGDVWLMRSDGEKQQEIVENGTYPSWSPDSKQIVFSRQNSQGSKRVLWVINRDGSGLKQITF